MSINNQVLSYKTHLGMQKDPFLPEPDPAFYYAIDSFEQRLTVLQKLVQGTDDLILVLGARGCGKTTLLQRYLNSTDMIWETNRIQTFPDSVSSPEPNARDGHPAYILRDSDDPIVIVDDAHMLSRRELMFVLQEALVPGSTQLIKRLILFGESDLHAKITTLADSLIADSVINKIHLSALTMDETSAYLQHRLSVAGYKGDKQFSTSIVEKIHQTSGGLPGPMNEIADQLLKEKYSSKERPHGISSQFANRPGRVIGWVAAGILVLLLAALLYFPYRKAAESQPEGRKIVGKVFRAKLPENLETRGKVFRAKLPGEPETAGKPLLAEKTEKPEAAEKVILTEKTKKPEAAEKVILAEKKEKSEAAEKVILAEKTKKSESAEKVILAEKKEKSEAAEKVILAEKKEKSEAAEKAIPAEKAEKPETTKKVLRAEKPAVKSSITLPVETETAPPAEEKPVPAETTISPQEKSEPPEKTAMHQAKVQPPPAAAPAVKGDVLKKAEEGGIRREKWLLSQDSSHYTIQIVGVSIETSLLDFINKNKSLETNKLAFYKADYKKKDWYPLLYGVYATKKDAASAINELPDNIRKSSPWIRSMSSVQKEIRLE